MAILPGHDFISRFFTPQQLFWISFSQYLVGAIAVAVFFRLVANSYLYLWKGAKYRVLPLLVFYLLSMTLVIFRFYADIWYFVVPLHKVIFIGFSQISCKFCLGLVQTWIIVELCLQISYSIKVARELENG